MTNPLPLSDYSARREPPPIPFGRRSTDREPRTGWTPVVATVLAVAGVDWATKILVHRTIPLEDLVPVWPGRLALWHVANPAMILGLHGDLPLLSRKLITILAALLAAVLFFEVVERGHRLPRERRPVAWLCIGLAFGGMLGNFGERLLYWRVTDFLSLGFASVWLPPTNVADVALIASLPLSLLVIRYELDARAKRNVARVTEIPRVRPSYRVD